MLHQLAVLSSLALCLISAALNLDGDIRLYTNFDAYNPLNPEQWEFMNGSQNETAVLGHIQASNVNPFGMISSIPYCLSNDFVLQMNAKVVYNATLSSGSVNSVLGWNEDPYYGCAYVGAVNMEGWRFMFLITAKCIYALYAHYPDLGEGKSVLTPDLASGRRFAYIIPIAKHTPGDENNYSVNMKAQEYDVSYRINNVEKLIIRNVGQTVAGKFLVWSDSSTFDYTQVDFPTTVYMQIGVGSFGDIGPIGAPNTVCQRTLFDQCSQNVLYASRTFCRYGQIQVSGWELEQAATLSNVFISRLANVENCPDGGFVNEDSTADHWWSRN